ncbi:hypothetical protein DL98DRAFT_110572 [Cadophora sp. DSE1049]|nr:hypothetical protein DL98DRAFT_110572 [Cadophora sp. DSE1049]
MYKERLDRLEVDRLERDRLERDRLEPAAETLEDQMDDVVYTGVNTEYQEIVFDSNSVHSGGSNNSAASGASGRRGPLSEWARAGMNAVKKIGACWRCKFLRKTCDSESPCPLCPKADKSNWAAVGCKRGPFEANGVNFCPIRFSMHFEPFVLCSGGKMYNEWPSIDETDAKFASLRMLNHDNSWFDLDNEPELNGHNESFSSRAVTSRRLYLEYISSVCKSADYAPVSNALTPVTEGVLAFVWEWLHCDPSCSMLSNSISHDEERNMHHLATLLSSAAVCQAKFESDQLIAQSLICLRCCAQALHVMQEGHLEYRWHRHCSSTRCKIECIATINTCLKLYLQELSRVFFKKENMRNPYLWWLSTLYSFCIQSVVRKALLVLEKGCKQDIAAENYLHQPIRLFIAVMSHDLINMQRDLRPKLLPEGRLTTADISAVERAVEQNKWEENGINSTAMYLRRLFEMEESNRTS